MILKQLQGKWNKVWEQSGTGHGIDWGGFADITGDGIPELVVGWTIGASAGNGLDIFSWQEGNMKKNQEFVQRRQRRTTA